MCFKFRPPPTHWQPWQSDWQTFSNRANRRIFVISIAKRSQQVSSGLTEVCTIVSKSKRWSAFASSPPRYPKVIDFASRFQAIYLRNTLTSHRVLARLGRPRESTCWKHSSCAADTMVLQAQCVCLRLVFAMSVSLQWLLHKIRKFANAQSFLTYFWGSARVDLISGHRSSQATSGHGHVVSDSEVCTISLPLFSPRRVALLLSILLLIIC